MPVKQTKEIVILFGKSLFNAIKAFGAEHSFTYGAALAYYSIFAIVPIFYLSIVLIGFIFGVENILFEMTSVLTQFVGEESALEVTDIVKNLNIFNADTLTNIISICVLLYSTTAIFWSIKSSLHLMWKLKPQVKSKILKTLIDRFLYLLMLLIIGLILALTILSDTIFVIITDYLKNHGLQEISYGVFVAERLTGLVMFILIFILLFKFLPDAIIHWKVLIMGAIFTGSLFYLGTYLISWYLSIIPFANKMGAAGPILIILLWVYYSAQIVFLGAKFTQVYGELSKRPITDNRK